MHLLVFHHKPYFSSVLPDLVTRRFLFSTRLDFCMEWKLEVAAKESNFFWHLVDGPFISWWNTGKYWRGKLESQKYLQKCIRLLFHLHDHAYCICVCTYISNICQNIPLVFLAEWLLQSEDVCLLKRMEEEGDHVPGTGFFSVFHLFLLWEISKWPTSRFSMGTRLFCLYFLKCTPFC